MRNLKMIFLILAVTMALFSFPRKARAAKFLETVGISTAAGAVLGAATLPFYDEPMDHKQNLLYGGLAGLVVGLGIWGYEKFISKEEEKRFFNEARLPIDEKEPSIKVKIFRSDIVDARPTPASRAIEMPLVSLNW